MDVEKSTLEAWKRQLKLYKTAVSTKKDEDYEKYKLYQNVFKKLKKYCRKQFYLERCIEFRKDTKETMEYDKQCH